MTVSELMSPPARVALDTSLFDCTSHMQETLLVVRPDGRLLGMLTGAALHRQGPSELAARDLCVPVDVVAQPDETLRSVVSRWCRTKQELVVVVDAHGRPVGQLTEAMLVQVAAFVLPTRYRVEHLPPRPVVTVDRLEPAAAALHAMIRHRIRHLLVTDPDGSVLGVVSYRDLVGVRPSQRCTAVGQLCTRQLELAHLDSPLVDCAKRMATLKKGCLPVLCGGRPARMVTRRDLIEVVAAELERSASPG
jgi:CBS domain-containing protein